MLRKSLFSLVTLLAFVGTAQAGGANFYKTEAEATQSCASDAVVWLKLDAHLYFHKDQSGYGVSDGLYACERGARKAGYFAAK